MGMSKSFGFLDLRISTEVSMAIRGGLILAARLRGVPFSATPQTPQQDCLLPHHSQLRLLSGTKPLGYACGKPACNTKSISYPLTSLQSGWHSRKPAPRFL